MAKRDEDRPTGRSAERQRLLSLAADKGYDDMIFREELRAEGVRPLIKHRVSPRYDYAHNARIDDDLYNQRSIL